MYVGWLDDVWIMVLCTFSCADPESFVRGGPNLIKKKNGWWGIEDLNTAINGPSTARQRNAIEMAFRWRTDDGQTLNVGLVALCFFRGFGPALQRNPIFFVISQGVRTPFRPWFSLILSAFNRYHSQRFWSLSLLKSWLCWLRMNRIVTPTIHLTSRTTRI